MMCDKNKRIRKLEAEIERLAGETCLLTDDEKHFLAVAICSHTMRQGRTTFRTVLTLMKKLGIGDELKSVMQTWVEETAKVPVERLAFRQGMTDVTERVR